MYQRVFFFLFVYAPQCGLIDAIQDLFYDQIRVMTAIVPASTFLIPCDVSYDHRCSTGSGYNEVHSDCGYGKAVSLF